MVRAMSQHNCGREANHLREVLKTVPIDGTMTVASLIEGAMASFNGRQLASACKVLAARLQANDTLIGVSLSGALVPAGVGPSCLIPLMRAGFIDWMVSTGANLYHDIQIALGFDMYVGDSHADDKVLRDDGVVRIFDLFFDAQGLYTTDEFIRDTMRHWVKSGELAGQVSSAQLHNALGVALLKRDARHADTSVLACAASLGIPVYTSSPGDSGIGMNLAAVHLEGVNLSVEPSLDVNETASFVYAAKHGGEKSAVLILGGGSPKNFVLQTEPHIQEVLGLAESGHDFFIQLTDARPDTGGLSGATPSEAVSWGKIDPTKVNGTVVCYGDCTVYLPLLTAFVMERANSRPHRRLFDRRSESTRLIREQYLDARPKSL